MLSFASLMFEHSGDMFVTSPTSDVENFCFLFVMVPRNCFIDLLISSNVFKCTFIYLTLIFWKIPNPLTSVICDENFAELECAYMVKAEITLTMLSPYAGSVYWQNTNTQKQTDLRNYENLDVGKSFESKSSWVYNLPLDFVTRTNKSSFWLVHFGAWVCLCLKA